MSLNIGVLARPLGLRTIAIVGTLLVVGGASYCLLRELLIYDTPSPSRAAYWAAVTMLPWLVAFECNKLILQRVSSARFRIVMIAAVLLLTLIVLGMVQWLIYSSHGWSFGAVMRLHAVSHTPETIIVVLLTVIAAYVISLPPKAGAQAGGGLPAEPHYIRWVKSAGNYVEFRTDTRSHVRRMTLRQAQELLDADQFIRISRSVVVNRNAIDPDSRGLHDHVRLADGTEHKIGDAYRAEIAKLV